MLEYQDAVIQKYSYNKETNETNEMKGGISISYKLSNDSNKKLGGGLEDFYVPIGVNYKNRFFTEKNDDTESRLIDGGMYDKLFDLIGSQEMSNKTKYLGGKTRKKK